MYNENTRLYIILLKYTVPVRLQMLTRTDKVRVRLGNIIRIGKHVKGELLEKK